jgi:hypothetical protein
MAEALKLEKVYVWLCCNDGSGVEGILGADIPMLGFQPLISGKLSIAESFRSAAESIASLTGKPVKLVEFTAGETLAEIKT